MSEYAEGGYVEAPEDAEPSIAMRHAGEWIIPRVALERLRNGWR